ncbi:MAG: thiamine pyrophosphate-dependent enzyme [Bacillota bacterium]|nr:thiamine pyrophosphate-dependent enzyme [Bacillota bacterium]
MNKIIEGSGKIGVICAGSTYVYAREALGDKASYLKLGMINPLPVELIKKFAATVEKLYVIEELDPIIETHCKAYGIQVIGKEIFSLLGEFNQEIVREKILGEKNEKVALDEPIPVRPPVMCCGCPHRGLFSVLKKLNVVVSGDIGCYTLASQAPISMLDTCVCMGASVSGLHGFNLARGEEQAKKSVAVLGDSTFIHSGITGLINIAYNKTNSKVIVLDNSITGMTGHQQNPTTGLTLKNEPTTAVDLEALAKAVGIQNVVVVDPYNMTKTNEIIKAEFQKDGPSLIISRRPCALLKSVKANPPMKIDKAACTKCGACLRIGCPAISKEDDGSMKIDENQCVGCGICTHMCKFGAIKSTRGNA